jgi:hypothetical protein
LHITPTVSEYLKSSLLSFEGGASLVLSAGREEKDSFSIAVENGLSSLAQLRVLVNKKAPTRTTVRVFFINIKLLFLSIGLIIMAYKQKMTELTSMYH